MYSCQVFSSMVGQYMQVLTIIWPISLNTVVCGTQAGWLILKSFPEHVDVLAFMNAIENIYGKPFVANLLSFIK